MKLTPDYRAIRATFEEHQNIPSLKPMIPGNRASGVFSKFRVGPFEYSVLIGPTRDQGVWHVSFELYDIQGTPQELAQQFSQIWKKKITPQEALGIKHRLLDNESQGRTQTGRSSEVLGHVMAAVNEFINKYYPQCIRFAALEPSRRDLYRRMIPRFLPDWDIHETGDTFTVCRKRR